MIVLSWQNFGLKHLTEFSNSNRSRREEGKTAILNNIYLVKKKMQFIYDIMNFFILSVMLYKAHV